MTIEFQVEGRPRRAALWLPEGAHADRIGDFSLVVFLHAYEERGDDFEHLAVGIGPALLSHPEIWCDAAVLMPQCPAGHVWAMVDRPWAEGCASAESHVERAVEAACARFGFGPGRISLTGASMGGYGTFAIGARRPSRFRALGPVCGGGTAADAESLAGGPVWAWHGADDDIVPVDESRNMIDAIEAAGGTPRLSVVEGAGHDVWQTVYTNPEFVEFLCRDRSR